jgi:hypothetical protein
VGRAGAMVSVLLEKRIVRVSPESPVVQPSTPAHRGKKKENA